MGAILVRDLSEDTRRALKLRASKNGRSVNAEIRATLDESVRPKERIKVGTEIRKLVEKYGGVELDIVRDKTPARFVDFSGPEFDYLDSDNVSAGGRELTQSKRK